MTRNADDDHLNEPETPLHDYTSLPSFSFLKTLNKSLKSYLLFFCQKRNSCLLCNLTVDRARFDFLPTQKTRFADPALTQGYTFADPPFEFFGPGGPLGRARVIFPGVGVGTWGRRRTQYTTYGIPNPIRMMFLGLSAVEL